MFLTLGDFLTELNKYDPKLLIAIKHTCDCMSESNPVSVDLIDDVVIITY